MRAIRARMSALRCFRSVIEEPPAVADPAHRATTLRFRDRQVHPEDIDPLWLLEWVAQGPNRSLGVGRDATTIMAPDRAGGNAAAGLGRRGTDFGRPE